MKDLAHTATAPATTSSVASPVRRVALGRFRLDRILGEGGMGVVYGAHDPELQRKVALKVLRHGGNPDASARLLREARAMAKLSHPHVITVFEVGSVDGEDFVAMELIDGETLGAWTTRARPGWREITAAYLAAGAGLVAAHVEGLVHRDFKPNNVLRSFTGRIVVTDFGLAREVASDQTSEHPSSDGIAATSSSTSRTRTGAMIGTPAYMAPEQWRGEVATAASDQFAFCVALWEALAGTRPFGGATLDELRDAVLDHHRLAADALPRPVRSILRRGLARDPARRWPDVASLLAALERALARRRYLVGAAVVVVIATAITAVTISDRGAGADLYGDSLDPDVVWSTPRAVAFAAHGTESAKLVDEDLAAWRVAWVAASVAPPTVRTARLACLDATLHRLDALVTAAEADHRWIHPDRFGASLVDPALCSGPSPPRILPTTPELGRALDLFRRPRDAKDAKERPDAPPCERAVTLLARMTADKRTSYDDPGSVAHDATTLTELGDQCTDDAIKALLSTAVPEDDDPQAMQRLEQVASAFPQDNVLGLVALRHATQARIDERWDDAWSGYEHALELFSHRHRQRSQIAAVMGELDVLGARARPADLITLDTLITRWRPVTVELGFGSTRSFDDHVARLRWSLGDVAGADATLRRLSEQNPSEHIPVLTAMPRVDVSGEVVDEAGHPVANAQVIAGMAMSDSVELASPLYTIESKTARTDTQGRFTIEGAIAMIAAQAGRSRSSSSRVAPHVRLVVQPTAHLEGRVEIGSMSTTQVWVVAKADGPASTTTINQWVAPVRPDHTFSFDGVARGKITIDVVPIRVFQPGSDAVHVVVTGDRLDGVVITLAAKKLYVIARTTDLTPPDSAYVWLFHSYHQVAHPTIKLLSKFGFMGEMVTASANDPAHTPAELVPMIKPDDLVGRFDDHPRGELMVCGAGFARKQLSATTTMTDLSRGMMDTELGCARVTRGQGVVVIDLPPLHKL